MQITRLLDDRGVLVGERLFDAQGRSYAFVEHSGGELVDTAYHGLLDVSLFGHNPENLATITVS